MKVTNRQVGSGRSRRTIWIWFAPTFLALVSTVIVGTAAWGVTGGTARISKPDGVTPRNVGGSRTAFALLLPSGARCPGDTAHKGYRLWSYLVQKGTNLNTISFHGMYPAPGLGFVASGLYVGGYNLALNTGEVLQLPTNIDFADFKVSDLLPTGMTSATWEGGLACSNAVGAMARYWNVELTFATNQSDPNGFTWAVTHPVSHPKGRGWERLLLAGALIVVGAVGARILWPRHRAAT